MEAMGLRLVPEVELAVLGAESQGLPLALREHQDGVENTAWALRMDHSQEFSIGFPHRPERDVVHLEGMLGSYWVEDPSEVDFYRAKFTEITAEALTIGDSLAFITARRDRFNEQLSQR